MPIRPAQVNQDAIEADLSRVSAPGVPHRRPHLTSEGRSIACLCDVIARGTRRRHRRRDDRVRPAADQAPRRALARALGIACPGNSCPPTGQAVPDTAPAKTPAAAIPAPPPPGDAPPSGDDAAAPKRQRMADSRVGACRRRRARQRRRPRGNGKRDGRKSPPTPRVEDDPEWRTLYGATSPRVDAVQRVVRRHVANDPRDGRCRENKDCDGVDKEGARQRLDPLQTGLSQLRARPGKTCSSSISAVTPMMRLRPRLLIFSFPSPISQGMNSSTGIRPIDMPIDS